MSKTNFGTASANSIQRMAAIFHPACLTIVGILAAIVGFAAFHAHAMRSPLTSSPMQLIILFVAPAIYWLTLLVLMARFFASCRKDGIFSARSISSVRWIGGILLACSLIRFATGAFAYLTSEVAVLFAPIALSNITNAIVGIFLLVLSKIVSTANRLDGDAQFTI